MNILLTIAIILLVLWLLGWAIFPILGFFIHILLIIAIILLIMWLIKKLSRNE